LIEYISQGVKTYAKIAAPPHRFQVLSFFQDSRPTLGAQQIMKIFLPRAQFPIPHFQVSSTNIGYEGK
jgi:hypothetical protein